MKKILIIISVILCITAFLYILKHQILFRSEEGIKKILLAHVPRGSSPDEVLKFTQSQMFQTENRNSNYNQQSGAFDNKTFQHIGVKSIKAILGQYHDPFEGLGIIYKKYVYVVWGFDENDKLLDVIITKEIDAL